MKKSITLFLALVFIIFLCGCNKAYNEGYESSFESSDLVLEESPESTEPIRNYVPVSWDDFIKFNGETYIGDWRVTEVSSEMIGGKIGEVTCGPPETYIDENGNICDIEPENGASYMCSVGTELFAVKDTDYSIAALVDGKYYLYTKNYPVPA